MAEKRVAVRLETQGDGQVVAAFEGMSNKAVKAIYRIVDAENDTVRVAREATAAVLAEEKAFDALRASVDPAHAATRRYEQAVEAANRAVKAGVATQAQAETVIRQARTAYLGAAEGADRLASAGGRFDSRGIAMQLSQVAQSASATGDPIRALAIQLPDLAMYMGGAFAIAAGIAAGALLPLVANLFDTKEELKEAEKAAKEWASSIDEATSSIDRAETAIALLSASGLDKLKERYGLVTEQVRELVAELADIEARSAAQKVGAILGDDMVAGFAEAFGDKAGSVAASLIDSGPEEIEASRRALEEARRELELMQAANSPAAAAAAQLVAELEQELAALEGRYQDMGELADQLGPSLEQIARVRELQSAYAKALDERDFKRAGDSLVEILRVAEDAGVALEEGFRDKLVQAADVAYQFAGRIGSTRKEADALGGVMEKLSAYASLFADGFERAQKSGQVLSSLDFTWMGRVGASLGSMWDAFASNPARLQSAAEGGILDLIGYAEGTDKGRGYNETLGYGAYTGGPVNLINMSLDKVLELQRQMLAHPDNSFNSSAVGRYQIVSTTLRSLMNELNLTGREMFDPAMQDRLAMQLVRRRMGQGVDGFRQEWEGLRYVNDKSIMTALGAQPIAPHDAGRAQTDRAEAIANANNEYQRMLGLMDPLIEAQRAFAETQRQLDEQLRAGLITPEQWAEGMTKAKTALDATRQSMVATQAEMQRLNSEARTTFKGIFDDLRRGAGAGEIFANVLGKVADRLADMAATGFADALFPVQRPNGGASGGFLGSLFRGLFSFDGGGYTGDGPRSGGLDGRGGYLAMLHPRETVIDHTKGQRASGGAVELLVRSEPGTVVEIVRNEAGAMIQQASAATRSKITRDLRTQPKSMTGRA